MLGVSHIKVIGILLALLRGVNYRFWVSLRVFGSESNHIGAFRCALEPCIKKFTKKCCDVCFSMVSFNVGVSLSLSHTQWGGGIWAGMGWGFDCLSWSCRGRAFDWACSPTGGDIGIFLRPTWQYLTANSDEKHWDRTYVSYFHAWRMRRTVWKHLEIMEANKNKRKLSGFHCFVFKFCLF